MRALIILSILFAASVTGLSDTLYVPGDYATIQEAIDAAIDGDMIVVAPGTYVENIDFDRKAIVLMSSDGPEETIIDGNDMETVVLFESGEKPSTVLTGFTITNGFKGWCGGGISCTNGSSPMIINNIIYDNRAHTGGAIFCENSDPIISNNIIEYNTSDHIAGIYCENSEAIISDNVIQHNLGDYCGGICCKLANPKIFNNVIGYNYSDLGGGINCYASNALIHNNLIIGNTADRGAGIYLDWNSSPKISNNTLCGNSVDDIGGGIYCTFSTPYITDTIFWNNQAGAMGDEIYLDNLKGPSTLTICYSDVTGGNSEPYVYAASGCTIIWDSGMINEDPLFVTGPDGDYYLSQIASGQPVNSPCIDAGSDAVGPLNMHTLWTRTDEVPDSGTVDMGFHYGNFITPALWTDTEEISLATGGTAQFFLFPGVDKSERQYLLLGSVSGTWPGIPLPGGMTILPLNWDVFTVLIMDLLNSSVFHNFMGWLDDLAMSQATLNVPMHLPSSLIGLKMNFAYTLKPFDFVSNPVVVEIVP